MDISSIINETDERFMWSTSTKIYKMPDPPTEWTPASTAYRNRHEGGSISSFSSSLPPNSPPSLSSDEECRSQSTKVFQFHMERSKAIPVTRARVIHQQRLSSKKPSTRVVEQPTMTITSALASFSTPQTPQAVPRHQPRPRTKQTPVRSIDPKNSEGAFSLLIGPVQITQLKNQLLVPSQQQQQHHQQQRKRCISNVDPDDDKNDKHMTQQPTNLGKENNQQQQQQQHMTVKTSSADRHMKKAKTEAAAAYDTIAIHEPESLVFDPEWIPRMDAFTERPLRVVWKGTPLNIEKYEYYDKLHPGEVAIASTLRLLPEQYIRCKRVLVLAAQEAAKENTPFRKSEAQKLCRIDVNKVSTLWSTFGKLGWLGPRWSGNR
ncbi:hypothetical protein BX666DRAFT_1890808 [Dichotomocladium elegans]|nr:hypothetical protein BX666DRAFT_1890808 [Dichotomocladium elegans]